MLKPVDDIEQAAWIAEVLDALEVDGVRVPKPIRSRDGAWVADGWTAMQFVDGRREPRRWREIIDAGRVFHRALARLPRPAWMDEADDWWRRADQVAWEERQPVGDADLVALVQRLLPLRLPLTSEAQVIHADLCGNVLFDLEQRPVVIDFSPYWRPAEWASAVVVIDAMEWEDAGAGALGWLDDVPDAKQLLVRAAIFRIATSAEVAAVRGLDERKLAVHRTTVGALERLL